MKQQERDELREEMRYDDYMDGLEELKMRDEDYALGKHYDELQRIYDELQAICKQLEQYNHEFTPSSLINVM